MQLHHPKKNHPVHSFYWIFKLLLLLLNNHFGHQPCRAGEVHCVSAIKLVPGSTSLRKGYFICRRWSSSSDTVHLGTSEGVQRPETETDINSWVASVFIKFSLVLLLCTEVSIWMKAKRCSHDATLLPSASPGNLFSIVQTECCRHFYM